MQRGFTLVETIVAIALVVSALVALAQLVMMGVQTGVGAHAKTMAALIAGTKMEELRSLTWGSVRANESAKIEYFDVQGTRVCVDQAVVCAAARYQCRWAVQPAPFNAGVVLIEVTVQPLGAPASTATFVTARSRKTP